MAKTKYIPFSFIDFAGGLNDASGDLKIAANESDDLANINFNKTGSITKRLGYFHLNTTPPGLATPGSGQPEGTPYGVSMPDVGLTFIVATPGEYRVLEEMPDVTIRYTRSIS